MINVPTELREQVKASWEELVSRGLELREGKDDSQWKLGDLAMEVEKSYGNDSIGRLAVDININKKSLQQYRRVSEAFPKTTRSKILSHRHHLILAPHLDRFILLTEAEVNGYTCAQLERMFSKNPQEIVTKKMVIVCEHCKKLMVTQSNICLGHHESKN